MRHMISTACVTGLVGVLTISNAFGETNMSKTDSNDVAQGMFGEGCVSAADGLARAEALGLAEYEGPPLTVELWAKLNSKTNFNIMLAYAPKESPRHWEFYTYLGSGSLSVYLPGLEPAEIQSNRDITDGQWHYLAFVFEPARIRLYVDGEQVADRTVSIIPAREQAAGMAMLSFGRLVSSQTGNLGCDGVIDEVRVSKVAREINAVPQGPFETDADTVGLWHFDEEPDTNTYRDASRQGNHAAVLRMPKRSLDAIDLASYDPQPGPMDTPAVEVDLTPGEAAHPDGPQVVILDGTWQMAEAGSDQDRLAGNWADAVPAEVPGSVHSALFAAGKIPDPRIGLNDAIAREQSFKTWWFRRTFQRPDAEIVRLVFDGVSIRGTVWLNGVLLGSHEGMFGGPVFDVSGMLREENTLVVKIDPAPHTETGIHGNNQAWRQTVVFNNVWGWHYSNIPALGIWRSVRVEEVPPVEVKNPFVAARDAQKGLLDISVALHGPLDGWSGTLVGDIEPENFEGKSYHFESQVISRGALEQAHLRVTIPDPKLWWPNDIGEQNLYKLKVSFIPADGGKADSDTAIFGIRTVEMRPLPGGPYANKFNWTFVINGRPMFVKGNGWCTMDPLMDFSYERYDRFISLAQSQHIQMFRGWGSGMPETDAFYDLCNRKGIMVLQEWPTAWNSHLEQPFDMLEETVRLNTLRLRNNPSLVMWGAGNESSNPFGTAIDMMGRYSVELDGTRPFHRGEPWGGSIHNYDCYWGRQPLDRNLRLTADFIGEFGLACMPDLESVLRYLPEDEKDVWPPAPDGALAHHTPIFNTAEDMSRLEQYSSYFMPQDSLEHFIIGSQLSQATGVRHPLELNRTRWPECAGCLYYKMNDNYPAASWSCADWYGAPKIGHYIFQDAFSPLHACALFSTLNPQGQAVSLPVFALDDADALTGAEWEVIVSAYDATLGEVKRQTYKGSGSIDRVRKLGTFDLGAEQTQTTPLLIVVELRKSGMTADRTFYWTNYEAEPGCLMRLPRTKLSMHVEDGNAAITNDGAMPAVAVHIQRPGHADTFMANDNYFWLNPGETVTVGVNEPDGLTIAAWNADKEQGR